jgi:hypothetical protein
MKHTLSILAVSKREAHFMREWIEFHRLVGVEHFYIYDAVEDKVEETLAPYVREGIVTLVEERRHPCQWEVYGEFFANNRDTKWCAVLDLDEFIVPKTFDRLDVWLEENFDDSRIAGVGIGWHIFGSSGHERRQPGLLTENYTRCVDYPVDRHDRLLKSIVRPSRCVPEVGDPHFFTPRPGFVMVNPLSNPIQGSLHPWKYPTRDVQLNHYFAKSREDFEHKVNRGSADINHYDPERVRKMKDWDTCNLAGNNSEDHAIKRFLPELKRRVSEIEARYPVTYF